MRAEQIAFIEAIADEPEDDALRLIYADWLDENGDEARAEFIRVQCELEQLDDTEPRFFDLRRKEASLLAAHYQRWIADLLPFVTAYADNPTRYSRGFLRSIVISPAELVQYAEQIFMRTPCRAIELDHIGRSDFHRLAHWPQISKVRRLSFMSGSTEDLASLLASAHLTRLESLSIQYNSECAALIAAWPGASCLRELSLFDGSIGCEGLRALAESPHLSSLKSLIVAYGNIEKEGAEALARSELLAQLTELDLTGNHLCSQSIEILVKNGDLSQLRSLNLNFNDQQNDGMGDDALRHLAGCETLTQLESLYLQVNSIGAVGAQHLASSENLRSLRELDLEGNLLYVDGVAVLANASCLTGLRSLNLAGCELDDEALTILAGSDSLRPRSLDLSSNEFGDSGIEQLLRSPVLGNVARLSLGNLNLSDATIDALVNSPFTSNLLRLSVSSTGITENGAMALMDPSSLPGLRELILPYSAYNEELRARLSERFGSLSYS